MMTRLYTRIRSLVGDLANKNISKQLFLTTVREEIMSYFPNRIFKMVDTSNTRLTEIIVHLPILFVEVDPKDDAIQNIQYTILVNVDRIGNTDVLSTDLFIGALAWQLDHLDSITKTFISELDRGDTSHIPDFQYVLKYYLENHLRMITYLREQYAQDFSFAILNGIVSSPAEIDALIDRIDYDYFLDIDEELVKVLGSKYHLPMEFLKLVKRVYDNHKMDD